MVMKMKLKKKNISYRYDINRSRPRHGHKYAKYKMCLSIMMVRYIKQHLKSDSHLPKKFFYFLQ